MSQINALILAAGKGTRMKSELPKVLHKVAGKKMVDHVIQACKEAGVERPILIVGHQGEKVQAALGSELDFVFQHQQLGTGHAVMQAEELLKEFNGSLLVLCGDTPLVQGTTLTNLVEKHIKTKAVATVLTALMEDPTGYGRIIRGNKGTVERIVEQKDATEEQLKTQEINTGAYCFDSKELYKALQSVTPANSQGEYYLTDVLEIFVKNGQMVQAEVIRDPKELMGVNHRIQLAEAEKEMRIRKAEKLMLEGVTIIDPSSSFIDWDVSIGMDTVIHPFTIIEGQSTIGRDCEIGPSCRFKDVTIGNNVIVQNSILLESTVDEEVNIGPYAYIRPGTKLGKGVKVGDFVEIKKSHIGVGSKVPHLSYIGDSVIGEKVNIGAGTITCNYDGVNKSLTTIEDGAFIGSNTNLVAPVKVGKNAVIAAGSTITKNVPSEALGLERSKQVCIPNWNKTKGSSS